MKLVTMAFAGLMAISAIVPTTAMAQRGYDRGWDDRRDDRRGWNDRRGNHGARGWDRGRRHDDRRRYVGNWGGNWGGNRYGGPRTRTVCRWADGYYGPVKRCFQVRR